jgi:hypothetical protein
VSPTNAPARRALAYRWLTVLGTTGIAALILPFTDDYSPLKAAVEQGLWRLAVPFFLAPLASAASLRWIVSGRLSPLERLIAYVVSAAMVCVTVSVYFMIASWPSGRQEWLSMVMPAVALVTGIAVLIRSSRLGRIAAVGPVLAIQVAYLCNGLLCLIAFFGDWQVGAYFVLVTAVVFVIQIVLMSDNRTGRQDAVPGVA